MAKSTSPKHAGKSRSELSRLTTAKPYAGFPLTYHPSGRWCKKIRGSLKYCGKAGGATVGEAEANAANALETFNRNWPYWKDGKEPPAVDMGDRCTVRLLCNAYLNSKKALLDSDELSPRSFKDYSKTYESPIARLRPRATSRRFATERLRGSAEVAGEES